MTEQEAIERLKMHDERDRLENFIDRELILPNKKKDSRIIKEFAEEILTGKE